MAKHSHSRLDHIIDSCKEIVEFTDNMEIEDFIDDRTKHYSVIYLIGVIGEAANNLNEDIKDSYPDIPWSDIISMRNRLYHGYDTVDLRIVWKTAKEEVPDLLEKLESKKT
jgi:uncharacterized protein with HEPN domain